MRLRAAVALTIVAGAAVVAGAGARGTAPAGRLTYVAWIERGGGTGFLTSPLTLCEMNADGGHARQLSPRIGSFGTPAWTRDGARVAFAAGSAVMTSAVSPWAPRRVASNGRWPAWSPDGRRIAYVGPGGVAVAAADGSGAKVVAGGAVAAPSWSADGTRIAFSRSGVAGVAGVFVVPSAAGAEVQVNDDGWLPSWAPDGTRLAFVATRAAPSQAPALLRQELDVSSVDGTSRVRLSNFDAEEPTGPIDILVGRPAWSPDSSTVAVVRTVVFHGAKGSYVQKRNLFLFDAVTGARVDASPPEAFDAPAWRPAASIAAADAAAKPCEVLGSGGTLRGTAYDDLVHGSARVETILSGGGNDWVHAERGADTVDGGAGRDDLWSGPGRDRVLARDGARDVVHCGDEGTDAVRADASDVLAGRCRRSGGYTVPSVTVTSPSTTAR